jgi:hypothetical protein
MPAAKSSSQGGSVGAGGASVKRRGKARTNGAAANKSSAKPRAASADDPGGAAADEDLSSRLSRPLDFVLLTRERIQATLDEAAERGRVTRSDANELVAELIKRGRQGTDDLLDRARRSVGAGPSFPISGYDELTVGQVAERLPPLTPPQLRQVRDYERRHANRKSVLGAIEKRLV